MCNFFYRIIIAVFIIRVWRFLFRAHPWADGLALTWTSGILQASPPDLDALRLLSLSRTFCCLYFFIKKILAFSRTLLEDCASFPTLTKEVDSPLGNMHPSSFRPCNNALLILIPRADLNDYCGHLVAVFAGGGLLTPGLRIRAWPLLLG